MAHNERTTATVRRMDTTILQIAASTGVGAIIGTACGAPGADGRLIVELSGDEQMNCRCLAGADLRATREGDSVLIISIAETDERIVVGRIRRPDEADVQESADELVIEARKSLTLKVGDGSITIREDGRILIKGKDLVSHAKRMNRIRGGSVTIN
jgi:hypothetical protein